MKKALVFEIQTNGETFLVYETRSLIIKRTLIAILTLHFRFVSQNFCYYDLSCWNNYSYSAVD